MERKWYSLQTLLIVGVVFIGIVVLLRLMLARSQTVVQQPQGNPWVALIDAAPGLVKSVGGLVGGIFSKHDENPSGIDDEVVQFIDDIPQDRTST
jgi:hypothetical protein